MLFFFIFCVLDFCWWIIRNKKILLKEENLNFNIRGVKNVLQASLRGGRVIFSIKFCIRGEGSVYFKTRG